MANNNDRFSHLLNELADERMEQVDERLGQVEERLRQVEERLEQLEQLAMEPIRRERAEALHQMLEALNGEAAAAANEDVEEHKRKMLRTWEEMRTEPPANCTAAPRSEDNLFVWDASIFGPSDSPYEGGIFHLIMEFEPSIRSASSRPPKVRFTTPIFHPNVDRQGEIGLDILGTRFFPALTIPMILLSISSLLTEPNPHESFNVEAAQLFLRDRQLYNETAKQWTRNHALE